MMRTETRTKHYFFRPLAILAAALAAGLIALAAQPAEAALPGPNGRVVFESNRTTGPGVENPEGDFEIFSMNPEGTGVTQLTHNDDSDYDPAWSADGLYIAFVSNRDGNAEIYRTSSIGLGLKRLTHNDVTDHDPTWSPDGKKIAFSSYRQLSSSQVSATAIYTMDATDSANEDLLYWFYDGSSAFSPAWSPEGTEIAFVSNYDSSSQEIYKADYYSDNYGDYASNLTKLTSGTVDERNPAWSPDGEKIAYNTIGPGATQDNEIFTINAAGGSGLDWVTIGTYGDAQNPAFAPDGKHIAFEHVTNNGANQQVAVINTDDPSAQTVDLTSNVAISRRPDVQTRPNQAPVADDDSYKAKKGKTLTVADGAKDLLSNDTDSHSDPLTAKKVSDPFNGTLSLNADGSFTYTPDAGFTGTDYFTYEASDGFEDGNVATVTIKVEKKKKKK